MSAYRHRHFGEVRELSYRGETIRMPEAAFRDLFHDMPGVLKRFAIGVVAIALLSVAVYASGASRAEKHLRHFNSSMIDETCC